MTDTSAKIVERLAFEIKNRERYVDQAKQRMTDAMATSYIDSGIYERLIQTMADLTAWNRVDAALSKAENAHLGLQAYIEDVTETLVTWTPSTSTSDIARVKDRAAAEARREVLRVIKHMI